MVVQAKLSVTEAKAMSLREYQAVVNALKDSVRE
jgi:hypothetical protein